MTLNPVFYRLYDAIIITICIFVIYRGYKKGMWKQITNVVSIILSFWLASKMYAPLASRYPLIHFDALVGVELFFDEIAWFVIMFIIFRIGGHFLGDFMTKQRKGPKGNFNHISGLLLGVLQAAIIVFLCIRFCQFPFIVNGNDYIQNGILNMIQSTYTVKKGELVNKL